MMEHLEINQIEVMSLKENDIVIIRINAIIPETRKGNIEEAWSNIFKRQGFFNIKVIVLSQEVGISVISKD